MQQHPTKKKHSSCFKLSMAAKSLVATQRALQHLWHCR